METKNLEEVYDEFGKYVVQQGRTNLTKKKAPQNYTGSLYNSLKYEILKKSDGKEIEIKVSEDGKLIKVEDD